MILVDLSVHLIKNCVLIWEGEGVVLWGKAQGVHESSRMQPLL